MSYRPLEIAGHFAAPPDATVVFDGRRYSARIGEPIAVTLLAHGVRLLGRSGKYHRGRGVFCGRGSCGACTARVDGLPSQRLCQTTVRGQHEVRAQNVLGTAKHDILATVDHVFAGGLDHHHLMTGSSVLNRVTVRTARELAGLGRLPQDIAPSAPPVEERRTKVTVVGAGAAGLAVAEQTRRAGFATLVLDPRPETTPDVRAAVLGLYDDMTLLAVHGTTQLRLRTEVLVVATGAYEEPPTCPGNDLAGVMARRAAEITLAYGVLPSRHPVVVLDGDEATRLRARILVTALTRAGAEVTTVGMEGSYPTDRLAEIRGGPTVSGVRLTSGASLTTDCVIFAGRPAPAYELPRQLGLATPYSSLAMGFVVSADADGQTSRPDVYVAGEVCGVPTSDAALHGERVGAHIARYLAERAPRFVP